MKIILATLLVFGLAIDLAVSQVATPGQFPSHAGLVFAGRFCGATVLNNRHILTAASCALNAQFHRMPVTAYTLHVGVVNIPATGGIAISHIFIHPEYNPHNEHWHNLAVFRTGADIPINQAPPAILIEPVEIYNRIVPVGKDCVLVGWNSPPLHLTTPLQHHTQSILSHAHCNSLPEIAGSVLNSMVCAGSVLGNPTPCQNNAGAALMCYGQLFGIMSHNRRCGQANAPGVFTQLRFYQDWIPQQFNRTDSPPAGPTHPPGHPGGPGGSSAIKSSLFVLLSLLGLRYLL